MSTAGNLFAQQEANRKASRRLIAGFILFVAWLGFGGDIIWYLATRHSAGAGGVHVFPVAGLVMTVVALTMAWAGYRFGPTMLMSASHAREIETDLFGDLASRRRLEHIRHRMGHVNVAADHSDSVRGILDTWCSNHQQPAVTAGNQRTDRDRVQLGGHKWIRTCAE